MKKLLPLIVALSLPAHPALAHPAPYSFLDLHFDASGLRGALVVHDFDAGHELGIEPAALSDPETARVQHQRLIAILQPRLHLAGGGHTLAPSWKDIEVSTERQSLRLTFEVRSRAAATLEVDARLFPYDPVHQTFVNIYEGGTLKHQAILNRDVPRLRFYRNTSQGRWQLVQRFVASGVEHILIGPDHVLFLLGLLLLGGSLPRLAGIVTAFTVGHSITLSVAALRIVEIASRIIEPAIALSIVVVATDNLLVTQARRKQGTATRDLRPWLAGAFGLIHGFGFASVLQELGLPANALKWSLATFNIGVEIGQLAIVIVLGALLALLRRRSLQAAEVCVIGGSVGVLLAGAYWFVQRVWFTL